MRLPEIKNLVPAELPPVPAVSFPDLMLARLSVLREQVYGRSERVPTPLDRRLARMNVQLDLVPCNDAESLLAPRADSGPLAMRIAQIADLQSECDTAPALHAAVDGLVAALAAAVEERGLLAGLFALPAGHPGRLPLQARLNDCRRQLGREAVLPYELSAGGLVLRQRGVHNGRPWYDQVDAEPGLPRSTLWSACDPSDSGVEWFLYRVPANVAEPWTHRPPGERHHYRADPWPVGEYCALPEGEPVELAAGQEV